ncbi:MAG: hypothetical protein MNPFHGCM_00132 [Gemmatimonadaceae bacterium]|nr:hypothetical protein [Gemmatimonadaceae bacterium]
MTCQASVVAQTTHREAVPIATVLSPDERIRIDAAGIGLYHSCHRESIEQITKDLRTNRIHAVLLSVNVCAHENPNRIARIVREYPRIPTVAVVSQYLPQTAQAVLLLGRCGVRTLVDVRDPRGWQELRRLLIRDHATNLQRLGVALLDSEVPDARGGLRQFFQAVFELAPRVSTVRGLSERLSVVPSTLMSRFFRNNLPAPKQYLTLARLACAAQLLENPGLSLATAANQMDYSSPQSFSRHVLMLMRMTPTVFRENYDGEGMLDHFRRELIAPYVDTLRHFDPLIP